MIKHHELIEELMRIASIQKHQSFYAQQKAFADRLNNSRAINSGEVKEYLELNRKNIETFTVRIFAIIIQETFRGHLADETAIECHRFILSRKSAGRNWWYWSTSQLALAKIYQQLDRPKSNDCIRQLVDAKIARDRQELAFFVCKTLSAFVLLFATIFISIQTSNLAIGNFLLLLVIKFVTVFLLLVLQLVAFVLMSGRPKSCQFLHQRLKLQKQLITTATSPVAPIEIDYLGGLIFQESRSDNFSDFLPTLFNLNFIKSLIRNRPWQ